MDSTLRALLTSWDWRPEIILTLTLVGSLYTAGWRRLRGRRRRQLANGWRLAAYLGGLVVLALALMSAIDILGGMLFFMHMIQHLLLVMVVPPLLLLANPLPFILWGLPGGARRAVARLLSREAKFRRALRALTPPRIAWFAFVAALLGWHDPNAYNAALRSAWIHDLEHLTFFGTALLYWWHVTGAGPRIHGRFSLGMRAVYLLVTIPVNMLAGIAIAFASQPIYTYYTTVPRLWGVSVMQDQMLGGEIMWVPGSMMYAIAAVILIARLLRVGESKQPLLESNGATGEAVYN